MRRGNLRFHLGYLYFRPATVNYCRERIWIMAATLALGVLPIGALGDSVPPQPVTAVWSNAQHLDLFTVNKAGQIVSTWWEGNCSWQPWFPISPGSAGAHAGQAVTAVWSNANHLDLFVTADDGTVKSTWWEAHPAAPFRPGWQDWFAIGPAGMAAPRQAVTALWSNPNHLDLFITGTDGAVKSTWWEANPAAPFKPGWQNWFPIGPARNAVPGQAVMAKWSNANHLDLFITAADGTVKSTWWEAKPAAPFKPGWQNWFAIGPAEMAAPGQAVTALWSNPNHLDLFITGTDGAVMSTWWEANPAAPFKPGWQNWFPIGPARNAALGQPVTAQWSNANHLDLFITAANGTVESTFWEAHPAAPFVPGWQNWFAIGPPGLAVAKQRVTALWNNPQHLDLFITGADTTVKSTWWESAKNWQPWFEIYPDGTMSQVEDEHNVLTNLHDNARTGAYLNETRLTPASVGSTGFGKLYQRKVEGQILAQPLYLRNVVTLSVGTKNLLLVATAANMVYAFDADDNSADAGPVFSINLQGSNVLDPANGNTTVNVCSETYPPYIGVTSTPVIDAADDMMYVVAYNAVDHLDYLHALDIRAGLKEVGSAAIAPPAGMITPEEVRKGYNFGLYERNRPSLLMLNGIVYVAFGSFICDNPVPYAGWVLGYSKSLQPVAAWRTPQNISGGGIWQSGRGLVGSNDGSIFFMTGNIQTDQAVSGKLGNSFVKLGASCTGNLSQQGIFEPANSTILSKGDTDLGSSGPILVDGLLMGGGKQGRAYVLDADTMQLHQDQTSNDGFQGFQAGVNMLHNDPAARACTNFTIDNTQGSPPVVRPTPDGGNADQYCRDPNTIVPDKRGFDWTDQQYPAGCYLPVSCYQLVQQYGPNIHAGFVFWPAAPDHGLFYLMAEKDHLRSFEYLYASKRVVEQPFAVSSFGLPEGMPGGALAISANGMQNGVVWVSMPASDPCSNASIPCHDATGGIHRGTLLAADANTLQPLWRDDCVNYFAKFNAPIIADGKVVLATFADPSGQAVPGMNCSAPDPVMDTNPKVDAGTAWLIVYGIK